MSLEALSLMRVRRIMWRDKFPEVLDVEKRCREQLKFLLNELEEHHGNVLYLTLIAESNVGGVYVDPPKIKGILSNILFDDLANPTTSKMILELKGYNRPENRYLDGKSVSYKEEEVMHFDVDDVELIEFSLPRV